MYKIIISANTDWFLYNYRLSLIEFLQEQGNEVVLVTPPGEYVSSFEDKNLRWRAWDLGRQSIQPWREIPSLLQLAKIYRSEAADLHHHHTIKPVLYGSLTGRLLGFSNIVNTITGRGYVYLGKSSKAHLLKGVVSPMYRLALSHPNYAVIFENEVDRQYFIDRKFISRERTWIVPGAGVDIERYQPSQEPDGTPVVMFSGRLLWDKGIGVLAEAARLLHKKCQVRVVLVGEPDPGNPTSIDSSQLESWVEEGIVEWWGWQPDMENVYPKSHIVTLPTMYGEGVPTALLEAAACARPTVSSDIAGCRAVTLDGETGLLVPPDNPEALADALYTLIKGPELRGRMGASSRELILQNYTAEQMNLATLEIYQTVLRPSKIHTGENTHP